MFLRIMVKSEMFGNYLELLFSKNSIVVFWGICLIMFRVNWSFYFVVIN